MTASAASEMALFTPPVAASVAFSVALSESDDALSVALSTASDEEVFSMMVSGLGTPSIPMSSVSKTGGGGKISIVDTTGIQTEE